MTKNEKDAITTTTGGGSSLVLSVTDPAFWNAERVGVVRKMCAPTASDAEFAVFIEMAKRWELDPIKKEIFLVPRSMKVKRNGVEEWIEKHEPMAAEQGILARADRFPDFRGIKAAAVYQGDEITIDQVTGEIAHKSNPMKRTGKPIGAWAFVIRDGRQLPVEWVDFAAYYQANKQWDTRGATMIVKCARAAALRRAYPNTFGDYLAQEEMREEDVQTLERINPVTGEVTGGEPLTESTPTRESVREKVKEKVAGSRAKKKEEEPVEGEIVEEKKPEPGFEKVETPEQAQRVSAKANEEVKANDAAAKSEAEKRATAAAEAMRKTQEKINAADPGAKAKADAEFAATVRREKLKNAVARFGGQGFQGVKLSTFTEAQLLQLREVGATNLAADANAKWAPMVRENLAEIDLQITEIHEVQRAEQERKAQADVDRHVIPGAPVGRQREPGDDDGDDETKAPF